MGDYPGKVGAAGIIRAYICPSGKCSAWLGESQFYTKGTLLVHKLLLSESQSMTACPK